MVKVALFIRLEARAGRSSGGKVSPGTFLMIAIIFNLLWWVWGTNGSYTPDKCGFASHYSAIYPRSLLVHHHAVRRNRQCNGLPRLDYAVGDVFLSSTPNMAARLAGTWFSVRLGIDGNWAMSIASMGGLIREVRHDVSTCDCGEAGSTWR